MAASTRRLKLMVVATLVLLVVMLWYSRDTYRERQEELYRFNADRKAAKERLKSGAGSGHLDDDLENAKMQQRLKDAEEAAKRKANDKAPNPPAPVVMPGVQENEAGKEGETPEEKAVLIEIDDILKRSPVIIFSKTYCPYSKAAKKLLMETYKIVPPPHVVELDIHEKGPKIQDALLQRTGRRTVPNILVQGQTIGGSDDIAALEEKGELVKKIRGLGGGRIMSMDRIGEAAKL